MFGVEDLIRGGHHELALPIVELDLLNVLVKRQRVHPAGGPGEVVGELFTRCGALFRRQKTIELSFYQIVEKAVAIGGGNRAHQVF